MSKKLPSRVIRLVNRESAGFTLIELIITIAIGALLSLVLSVSIFQLEKVGSTVSDASAIFAVNNAGRWVSKDAMMAQTITLGETNGFPITFNWTEYNGTEHIIVYSIAGGNLTRNEETASTLIAQYIDQAGTSCTWNASGGEITLTITAKAGSGSWDQKSETRIFKVKLRPYSQ